MNKYRCENTFTLQQINNYHKKQSRHSFHLMWPIHQSSPFDNINPLKRHRIFVGAIAGNVIFNLGAKDNALGKIGKVVLDNIVTGKFKRKVFLCISFN